jgi:anti-sigma regulatory factor (Ser/Thr protein kinase)/GNAT superfamily N-acetyltransferase
MQLELTFGNNQIHLPSVRAFLTATLQQFPLETVTVEKLGTFINAAVEAAISEAYPAGEEGWIKLSIQEQHGRLEIRIRDFGIPKDVKLMERQLQQAGATATSRLGIPAADVADEVHWLTFGPEGKALQVVKWLHETHIADAASDVTLQPFSHNVPLAPEQQYTIRRMRAREAEQVSQLMYRSYGNTYFNEDVYYPDRVAAQNERGVVLSYIAVNEDGDVAGHYALERNQNGPVAEGGQAVVDPAHRGRGLLDRMKDFAVEEARQLDLIGWYADAVTVHTLTQKSNAAHGGQLTAVDLAIAPKKEQFDKTHEQPQRVTCLLYFHWLRSPAARSVHVPARHRAIVGEIYKRLQCPIEFRDSRPPSGHGTLAVKIDAGAARANVYADTIGENTVQLVRQTRRELVERTRVEVVVVELPLEDPAAAIVDEQLERDGFGFLGIAPHFSQRGDVLRLAYLVEPLAREPIKSFDEIAGGLVDYTLREQERVRTTL